jgi:hypothetical protein
MSVIPLTIAISLCLAFTFVLFFLIESTRRRFSSAESEALLPLAEENRVIGRDHQPRHHGPERASRRGRQPHHDGPCGCRDGSRPPCAGCVKPGASVAPRAAA